MIWGTSLQKKEYRYDLVENFVLTPPAAAPRRRHWFGTRTVAATDWTSVMAVGRHMGSVGNTYVIAPPTPRFYEEIDAKAEKTFSFKRFGLLLDLSDFLTFLRPYWTSVMPSSHLGSQMHWKTTTFSQIFFLLALILPSYEWDLQFIQWRNLNVIVLRNLALKRTGRRKGPRLCPLHKVLYALITWADSWPPRFRQKLKNLSLAEIELNPGLKWHSIAVWPLSPKEPSNYLYCLMHIF